MSDRYRRRYRREGFLWVGEVYRVPEFVDWLVDGDEPVRVSSHWALTERGIRRKLARQLWRLSHPRPWIVCETAEEE
jgi:hypothetical protein